MARFDPFLPRGRRAAMRQAAGSTVLLVLVLGFLLHAIGLGLSGLADPGAIESRFAHADDRLASAGLFLHMAMGGAATILMPFQLLGPLRRTWPGLHRAAGYGIVCAAVAAALGGLLYMARQGTIGGPEMTAGFTLYGGLMLGAALQALRMARARNWSAHRAWALRLAVLILASWAYRLHYVLWYIATDGLWSDTATHLGAFDRVQNWAFYLPYLLLLEIWLRRPSGRVTNPAGSSRVSR